MLSFTRFETIIKGVDNLGNAIGKVGHFFLEEGTTIDMAKQMAVNFIKQITQIEDQITAANEAAQAQPQVEESKPEAQQEASCCNGQPCEQSQGE